MSAENTASATEEYIWAHDDERDADAIGEREGDKDWGPTRVVFHLSGAKADREEHARWLLSVKA